MDRIKRDTVLGIVFFGTLGFLLWATVNLTDLSLNNELVVYFPNGGSADVGTNVMVLGKKIGKVGAIDIDYDNAETTRCACRCCCASRSRSRTIT